MTNTVSAAGEAMPGSKLSRRSLLTGAAAALPVLAVTPAAAMASEACEVGTDLLALVEAHQTAEATYYATHEAYLSAEEALGRPHLGNGELVPIAMLPEGCSNPGLVELHYCADLLENSEALRATIIKNHESLLNRHCSPWLRKLAPEAAASTEAALKASRCKALRNLSKVTREMAASPKMTRFLEADAAWLASIDPELEARMDLLVYRPRTASEAALKASYISASKCFASMKRGDLIEPHLLPGLLARLAEPLA